MTITITNTSIKVNTNATSRAGNDRKMLLPVYLTKFNNELINSSLQLNTEHCKLGKKF